MGIFLDSEGCFVLNLFKLVASQLERKWISILHTFFPRGYNLEGKSNNRWSPRVHKASAMLWRKGSKPSLLILITKLGFLSMFFLMFLQVFLFLLSQFLKRMVHLLLLCDQILLGSHTFLLTEFLATEITKEERSSFLLLCLYRFSLQV
jgi:hypothetical protein